MHDIVYLLILIVILLVIAYVAKYIVDNFFPAPLHLPILALVGIILLLVLLWQISARFGMAVLK